MTLASILTARRRPHPEPVAAPAEVQDDDMPTVYDLTDEVVAARAAREADRIRGERLAAAALGLRP